VIALPRIKTPVQPMNTGTQNFFKTHKTLVICVVAVLIIVALWLLTSQPETDKSITPS
jgi:hypothetical protein